MQHSPISLHSTGDRRSLYSVNPTVGIFLIGWLLGIVLVIGGLWRIVGVMRVSSQHLGEIRKRLDRISGELDELTVQPLPDGEHAGR